MTTLIRQTRPSRLVSPLLLCITLAACTGNTVSPMSGTATIHNSATGQTILLKEPSINIPVNESNIVGHIESGSQVEILESKRDQSDIITLYRVRATSGSLKGKEGWVTDQNLTK